MLIYFFNKFELSLLPIISEQEGFVQITFVYELYNIQFNK